MEARPVSWAGGGLGARPVGQTASSSRSTSLGLPGSLQECWLVFLVSRPRRRPGSSPRPNSSRGTRCPGAVACGSSKTSATPSA